MKKRDLKDILREIQKDSVKQPEMIRKYIRTLGERTLYSLMYGDKERCSEKERYECWSDLEFVLRAYTCFWDLTDEETAYCMKHITFKDFLSLVVHLDEDLDISDYKQRGIIINDLGMAYMMERALAYLLKLLLRAKGRGDKDVNNFCMIHIASMIDLMFDNARQATSEREEEVFEDKASARKKAGEDGKKQTMERLLDCFYIVKDRLDLDHVSCMNLDVKYKKTEFGCLRELVIDSMEQASFRGEFSLPDVLERCQMMCRASHSDSDIYAARAG